MRIYRVDSLKHLLKCYHLVEEAPQLEKLLMGLVQVAACRLRNLTERRLLESATVADKVHWQRHLGVVRDHHLRQKHYWYHCWNALLPLVIERLGDDYLTSIGLFL